jgi:hypothetical protein
MKCWEWVLKEKLELSWSFRRDNQICNNIFEMFLFTGATGGGWTQTLNLT